MINDEQLQQEIIQSISADLLPETSLAVFKEKLSVYVNQLINHDFEKLIHILYRLDVSEKKLRSALSASSAEAGMIIAQMIIDRQSEKIKTREQYRQRNTNIDDEEKW
jgi:hypothetical protein